MQPYIHGCDGCVTGKVLQANSSSLLMYCTRVKMTCYSAKKVFRKLLLLLQFQNATSYQLYILGLHGDAIEFAQSNKHEL